MNKSSLRSRAAGGLEKTRGWKMTYHRAKNSCAVCKWLFLLLTMNTLKGVQGVQSNNFNPLTGLYT